MKLQDIQHQCCGCGAVNIIVAPDDKLLALLQGLYKEICRLGNLRPVFGIDERAQACVEIAVYIFFCRNIAAPENILQKRRNGQAFSQLGTRGRVPSLPHIP